MNSALFNSQLSSFLPREEFFSETETTFNDSENQESPNLSSLSASPFASPQSVSNGANSTNHPHHHIDNPLASSSSSPSQPNRELIVNKYKNLIAQETISGIKSIDELINWQPEARESIIGCVFGVIKSVRHSRGTKFKYVNLVDPTNENGIDVETFTVEEKIAVGQMMKISNLKLQRTASIITFLFTPNTKTSFFPLFSYDYDAPMVDERNKALSETRFKCPQDREICHLLEQWFSLKVLYGTQLSSLPKPGEYIDICCQVLAFNKNPHCINALVWDTTEPIHKAAFGYHGFEFINIEFFTMSYGKCFPLAVWKEENKEHAQHYDTFRCVDLTTGDDLVVLFNVQVVEDANLPGKVSLILRSSMKWGKAVRLCHRKSILGRMFMESCLNYRKEFRQKLGLPDAPIEVAEKSTPKKTPTKHANASIGQIDLSTPGDVPLNQPTQNSSDSRLAKKRKANDDIQTPPLKSPAQVVSSVNESTPRDNSQSNNPIRPYPLMSTIETPIPSTSGYSLRNRVTATHNGTNNTSLQKTSPVNVTKQPAKQIRKTPDDTLPRLKAKAAGLLNWQKLISNPPERLKFLLQILEEEDFVDKNLPLSREEYIQFVNFALDHRSKNQSESQITLSKAPTESASDSDESRSNDETFPVIDRVKYYTS